MKRNKARNFHYNNACEKETKARDIKNKEGTRRREKEEENNYNQTMNMEAATCQ